MFCKKISQERTVCDFWHNFQIYERKYVIMEMRKEHTEKRRRKTIHKGAELVRSAKPGQTSVPAWQQENHRSGNIWKMHTAA